MKSLKRGLSTPKPDVTNISEHGFWLLIKGREYFLPFSQFPWFKDANITQLSNVQLWHDTHLYWPAIDVDLSLNIITNPHKYPLKSK